MITSYQDIPLALINDSSACDLHPYLPSDSLYNDELATFQVAGIINPPTVVATKDGRYEIITGRRRLLYLRQIRMDTAPFRLLADAIAPEKLLRYIIEEQFLSGAGLNVCEQSCYYTLVKQLLPEKRQRQIFMGKLPEGRITRGLSYLEELQSLPAQIKCAIHHRSISEKCVTILQRFDQQDQSLLLNLSERLQLGHNKQKNLFTALFETINRNDVKLNDLLATEDIVQILSNEETNVPQKVSLLQDLLNARMNPRLIAAEKTFSEQAHNLKLPANCRLQHSFNFERDEVVLTISFASLQTLSKGWSQIRDAITSVE